MTPPLTLTFALAFLGIQGTWSQDKGRGRGLGEHFDWLNLEDGLRVAREEKKPLMVIIHKSWCGASKAFRNRFAGSQTIYEAAPNFVMVNIEDDDDPHHPALEPDGAYYPRILFFDPHGFQVDIPNPGRAAHKYYFPTVDVLIPAMYEAHRRVLEARESRAYEHDEM